MKTNRFPGKFIVIEGLDGAGHSTQRNLLGGPFLTTKGFEVVLSHEPTIDSVAGGKIERILSKQEKSSPENLQKLFAQDRKEHLQKKVIPALKEGKIVISDRYFFFFICLWRGGWLGFELVDGHKQRVFIAGHHHYFESISGNLY